jgi:hypothetical protein
MAKKRRLLISYFGHDYQYENGALRAINGKQNANALRFKLGTIGRSKNAQLPMRPEDRNFKNFLYIYQNDIRALFGNVKTEYVEETSIITEKTTFTLYYVPKKSSREWKELARDITLLLPDGVTEVVMNPGGIAQVGDWIYLIDYDSQKIYIIGVNELNGLSDGEHHKLVRAPFDLSATPVGQPNARGMAIGAARKRAPNPEEDIQYLYALYNDLQESETEAYKPSVLVRLTVDGDGDLAYDAQIDDVGLNTPEFSFVNRSSGEKHILVPAIGGMINGGFTNGYVSTIRSVPSFGDWSAVTAAELLTGVTDGAGNKFYDIMGISGSPRPDDNGKVLIVTGYFNTEFYTGLKWRFYETTIAKLLDAVDEELDLESALDMGILTDLEAGETLSPGDKDKPYGVYFLNGLYETGASPEQDRYWIFRGTELLVTLAGAYGSPGKQGNPYRFFLRGYGVDDMGAENVQSADLVIELTRQVIAGEAYKRSISALPVPPPDEEEEDEEEGTKEPKENNKSNAQSPGYTCIAYSGARTGSR